MTRPDEPAKTSAPRLSRRTKWLLALAVVVAVPIVLFRFRYCRTVVFRDLSTMQTKTVTLNIRPRSINWSLAGNVQGAGTLVISYVYSNTVSGKFVVHDAGDYYATNVTVSFVPNGPAKGKIRASFCFSEF
jgi:hypothetical protein